MSTLLVYLPPDVAEFPYPLFEESNAVRTTRDSDVGRCCGAIELLATADACACSARDGMAVHDRHFYCRNDASHVGHAAFRLPSYDRNRVECRTAVAWLICKHWKLNTFHTYVSKQDRLLYRTVKPAIDKVFERSQVDSCECRVYEFRDAKVDILYFFRRIVVSGDKKGPTFESALF